MIAGFVTWLDISIVNVADRLIVARVLQGAAGGVTASAG
jgi:hypothetical protein